MKLCEKYSSLKKLKDLDWSSSPNSLTKLQENFVEHCYELFDISVANFEQKIRKDRIRSKEAQEEDIMFYLDQKGEREMYLSSELDKQFEEAKTGKIERAKRLEELKLKQKGSKVAADFSSEMNISVDSAPESDISMPSSESSFDDLEQERTKEKKIMICISTEELIECTSTVAARYRVGIRASNFN